MNETWRTTHGDRVEVYLSRSILPRRRGYRYRVTALNGEVVEQGSESYTRKETCVWAAHRHHPEL